MPEPPNSHRFPAGSTHDAFGMRAPGMLLPVATPWVPYTPAWPSLLEPLTQVPRWLHAKLRQSKAFEFPGDEIYGAIRSQLESIGTPIGGNDLLIAAHAVALDFTLVTGNTKEFSRVTGLRVENWLRD
jgi:hypothetical protein